MCVLVECALEAGLQHCPAMFFLLEQAQSRSLLVCTMHDDRHTHGVWASVTVLQKKNKQTPRDMSAPRDRHHRRAACAARAVKVWGAQSCDQAATPSKINVMQVPLSQSAASAGRCSCQRWQLQTADHNTHAHCDRKPKGHIPAPLRTPVQTCACR